MNWIIKKIKVEAVVFDLDNFLKYSDFPDIS